MVNKENIFGVFFMFKKNKFLKFGSGAVLVASAPALISFAGKCKNEKSNNNVLWWALKVSGYTILALTGIIGFCACTKSFADYLVAREQEQLRDERYANPASYKGDWDPHFFDSIGDKKASKRGKLIKLILDEPKNEVNSKWPEIF